MSLRGKAGWAVLAGLLVAPIYHVWTHLTEILEAGDPVGVIQHDLMTPATFTDTLHVLVASNDFAAIVLLIVWVLRLKRALRIARG
jgi:hypothetical protein